jgi:O-antigen biosynthesis alpha-1,2-mannosyltransferase
MIRLAIDAENFGRDRRGMGRVARGIARAALGAGDFGVTFLLRKRSDERGLRAAFPERTVAVRPASDAKAAGRFDVVWYPWNGMRFPSRAPSLLTINDAFAFAYPARDFIARRREQNPIVRGAKGATRVVTCSGFSAGELARTLGLHRERIAIVPYAPDAFFFPAPEESPLGALPYVLAVGMREPRKNLRVVADACAHALEPRQALLAIVGDVAPDDLQRLKRMHVPFRVLRDVDDTTLRALYRNARAVLVPSLAEGFGLVAVEAMACGTATIAADATALPEACAGGAQLIKPHDLGGWVDAIRGAVDDDGYRTALEARGAEKFAFASRSAPGDAYVELLRGLAAR